MAALVSMNLSKQGLTANSKVQVSVGDGGEVKAVWVSEHRSDNLFGKKKTFHVLMYKLRHLHG